MKARLSAILNKLTHLRLNMNFAVYKQKYRDSENTKTAFMAISFLLLIIVIMQQVKINTMHERLVIVPPNLTKEAKITHKTANRDYLNDMALYIATQISAATPKTVDYISGSMEGFFEPHIWQTLKQQLETVKLNTNFAGIQPISQFTPTGGVIYEPETDKVFVVGELASYAYAKGGSLSSLGSIQAVYEMKLRMVSGMPRVIEWYAYTGNPKTQKWQQEHPEEWAKIKDERQIAYIPMVPESTIQRQSGQNTITMAIDQPPQQQLPQAELLQPSVPQPQAVQTQENLDPFADAANTATIQLQQNPQQANSPAIPQQQAVAPAAPAVILPNNQNTQTAPTNDDEPL